ALRGGIYISPDLAQKLALSRSMQLDDPPRILSGRERAVFELAVAGIALPEVASRLALSKRTASNYLLRIKHKVGIDSIADLVRMDVYRESRAPGGSDPR
ncbi:MAG: helix-turn-helix transcriptional regulator, partial [Salinisphaera sp.]|nr:helix-turn-helix transcriptional regulator [Salinisphaera sp.]